METHARAATVLFVFALLSALLPGGCMSKSSRFYTLRPAAPAPPPSPAAPAPPAEAAFNIAVVSVEIPDYLDRPQIVTRNGKDEVEIAEFDRWAGELDKDIARVLAETMSARLPQNSAFILTGRRIATASYRITVEVARFEATPDKGVWLKALWTVLGKDGRRLMAQGESDLTEPLGGRGYDEIVAAMTRAVDRLGAEIAAAVWPVLARETGAPTRESPR